MHWMQMQILISKRCFGKEHHVVQVQKITFENHLRFLEVDFELRNKAYLFVSLEEPEERLRVMVLLNALLKWAELPALTEEQLLNIDYVPVLKETGDQLPE
jgi:hypothetical protein